MEWVLQQLANPIVAAATAFVAGGMFTALINLASTEFSAERAERRLQRRELKELRLAAIDLTRRWATAYSEYVRDSLVNHDRVWNAEPYAGARLGLVGAEV